MNLLKFNSSRFPAQKNYVISETMCVTSYQSITSKQRHHHRPHCIFTQCLDCCIQYIEAKEDIKAPLTGFHAKIRAASLNWGLSTDYRLLFVQLLIAINSLLHKTIAVPWLEYEDFSEGWSVQGEPPARMLRIKFFRSRCCT